MMTELERGNPTAVSFFKFQAFTTAVVQDVRIRTRMKAAIAGNLQRGEGEKDFKKVVDEEFDKAGLTRLASHQVRNIYETNVSLAFGAGQMQKMLEVADDFPYWKFSATLDSKTRPSHAALHGKIFRVGDYTFFPPLSFRCRCTAIPLTARQAAQYLKSDMPIGQERDKLYHLIENKEFAGNKQQKFMEWAAKEYKKADPHARKLMDGAFEVMRGEIKKLKDDKPTAVPVELLENADYLKGTKVRFKEEFFRMIDTERAVKLVIEKKGKGSYYSPVEEAVHIVNDNRVAKSAWYRESVVYHEFGHSIDRQKMLKQTEEVKGLMKEWQKRLNKKQVCQIRRNDYDFINKRFVDKKEAVEIPRIAFVSQKLNDIYRKVAKMDDDVFRRRGMMKNDVIEQIAACQDTIKAINIKYGWGHTNSYFRLEGKKETEFIAHCFENKFAGNRVFEKYLPELYRDMVRYIESLQ